ncbi:MAG: 3-phosphoshikimate 1-carboxyvinyltransferase [Chlamydiia bacterium]
MLAELVVTPISFAVNRIVEIPGSKSLTNRALLLAAMADAPVRILYPLFSEDTHAMMGCLRTLGVTCHQTASCLEVYGPVWATASSCTLDADLSGTTARFLLALCAILPGTQVLDGKEGLRRRPIADLVEALRSRGAAISYLEKEGHLPVSIASSTLSPGHVQVSGQVSSQFLSALLMIAPRAGGFEVEVQGGLVSSPYVDLTIEAMKQFGVSVEQKAGSRFSVPAQTIRANEIIVEGDLSSAGYFLAIAALTRSTITLKNVNLASKQADVRFAHILACMGNQIDSDERSMTIRGIGVEPIDVNMEECPDQIPTLAVLAAFADGTTRIEGIRSLRVKETDRVFALQQELAKMGISTEVFKDTLLIHGGAPRAATIDTYGDHRMAMSFAVAAAHLPGMVMRDPEVVAKTFPGFWDQLARLGVGLHRKESLPCLI